MEREKEREMEEERKRGRDKERKRGCIHGSKEIRGLCSRTFYIFLAQRISIQSTFQMSIYDRWEYIFVCRTVDDGAKIIMFRG